VSWLRRGSAGELSVPGSCRCGRGAEASQQTELFPSLQELWLPPGELSQSGARHAAHSPMLFVLMPMRETLAPPHREMT
jgi:hypothetical protein